MPSILFFGIPHGSTRTREVLDMPSILFFGILQGAGLWFSGGMPHGAVVFMGCMLALDQSREVFDAGLIVYSFRGKRWRPRRTPVY